MPKYKATLFTSRIWLMTTAIIVVVMLTCFHLAWGKTDDGVANLSVAELKEIVRRIDFHGLPPNGPKKSQLLAALLKLGDEETEINERVRALSLQQVYLDTEVGAASKIGLEKLGEKVFPVLDEMLESSDEETVGRACSSIYLLGPKARSFVPKLIKKIESTDELEVAFGLFALQNMQEYAKPALPEMDRLIIDSHFRQQMMIAKICVGMGRDAAPMAKKLAHVCENGIPSAATWCGIALGAIGPVEDVDTVKLLSEKIDSPRHVEKERALLALSLMGDEADDAREKVKNAMLDKQSRVRAQAAYAYFKITDDAELPTQTLVSLLDKRDHSTDALHFLSQMGPAAASAVPQIIPLLESPEVSKREGAIIALGGIGPKAVEAKSQLSRLVKDPDPMIREAVKVAIRSIEGPQE